jgi:hypothetical protein
MTMWSEMNTHFPALANDFLENSRGLLRFLPRNWCLAAYLPARAQACQREMRKIYAFGFLLIEQSIKNML